MTAARDLFRQAISNRDAQDMDAAFFAIEAAVKLDGDDPAIAFLRAQISLETGLQSRAGLIRTTSIWPAATL
jgi:hypothetical protein